MSGKILVVPHNWREYVACLIVVGFCPLLPVFIEIMIKGSANTSSLLISSAIYCMSVSFITKSVMIFALSLPNWLVLSVLHGAALSKYAHPAIPPAWYHWFAVAIIVVWALILVISKYNEHVIDGKMFWDMGQDQARESVRDGN